MDALDVLKVCFRRWYVMLPVLMMALGTGYALAKNQEDSYYAGAAFAFVFQSTDPDQQETRVLNPLSDNQLLGTALSLALADPDVQESLGAPTAAGVAPGESSPDHRRFAFSGEGFTYTVAAWAPTADAAETTVQNVMDAIPGKVEEIQRAAGAPDGTLSTIFVMSPTRVDVLPASSGLKLMLGVGAVGAIAGASLSITVDALLARRSRIRRERAAEPAPSRGASSDAGSSDAKGDTDHGGDDGDGDSGGADGDESGDTDRGGDGEEPRGARSGHAGRSGSAHRATRGRARRRADARRAANTAQSEATGPPAAIQPANVQSPGVLVGTIRPPAILPATTRAGNDSPAVRPPTVQLTAVAPTQGEGLGDAEAQDDPAPFESLFR